MTKRFQITGIIATPDPDYLARVLAFIESNHPAMRDVSATFQETDDSHQLGQRQQAAEPHATGPDYGHTNMTEADAWTLEGLLDRYSYAEVLHTIALCALDDEI